MQSVMTGKAYCMAANHVDVINLFLLTFNKLFFFLDIAPKKAINRLLF